MKKQSLILTAAILLISSSIFAQNKSDENYPKSLASYNDFKTLVDEVEPYRAERLINLDEFLKMSKEKNVVILDTRSAYHYERKHLKGAIHLDFSDFTQQNLWNLIPDPNTKILIYCNNNFDGDQIDFTSKVSKPSRARKKKEYDTQILPERKPLMLALNIPTFINLYGYGYKNVYELDELVQVDNKRIKFEGTAVTQ